MAGLPSVRSWGDGKTARSRHLIADIQYGPKLSVIVCSDGTFLEAETPEELEELWRDHGGSLLDTQDMKRDPVQLSSIEAQERSSEARAAIALLASRCTCARHDPLLCPNHLPGDEEGDFSDDD